jgi:hypothetical protein
MIEKFNVTNEKKSDVVIAFAHGFTGDRKGNMGHYP